MNQEATPEMQTEGAPAAPTPTNPMVIPRIRKNSQDGVDVVLSLSQEQTYVLVNFAIMMLTSQGLAVFTEVEDKKEAEQQANLVQPGDEINIEKQIH